MNIFVAGATGAVGRRLIPILVSAGHSVVGLTHTPEKAKVTWGSASKEFSREQLEKGINLAAEFVEGNPFSEAFSRGEAAIKQQQNWETPAVKELLHRIPQYQGLLPDEKGSFSAIVEAVVRRECPDPWHSIRAGNRARRSWPHGPHGGGRFRCLKQVNCERQWIRGRRVRPVNWPEPRGTPASGMRNGIPIRPLMRRLMWASRSSQRPWVKTNISKHGLLNGGPRMTQSRPPKRC